MNQTQRLNLTLLVYVLLRGFIDGCEISFILPTALYYIKSLEQTKEFMALVVVSYDLSALITMPLIGRIADRFGRVDILVVLCIVLKVLGNLLYSINTNAAFPLVGRIISGIGQASNGLLFRQISLYIPEKRRAGIFVIADGAYCLGTTFGPAIGTFVVFSTNIFGWKINAGNSPGIILFFTWSIFLIWSLFLSSKFDVKEEWVKDEVLLEEFKTLSDPNEVAPAINHGAGQHKQSAELWNDCNSTVLCLFFLVFNSEAFSSISLFSTPLFAQEILHLQLIHVKLYFLNCSLTNFGLFLATYISSNYFEERNIVVFYVILQVIALPLLTCLSITWMDFNNSQYYILLSYIMLGSPFLIFSQCCSLLSKITHPTNAGFFQGVSVATIHIAYTVSRILMSFAFTRIGMIYFSFGLIVMWFIGAVWYFFAYRKLTVHEERCRKQ
ncbi:tetracycline resistance protein, class H-like [Xenia sp. Carnegie-2017]|uniref:tetracycline resistance protein, class H-like n=1 Tax=Xenia sp. Carnegie-2017 TaxID=2897299 RepID=UPI001F049E0C|nr:tetracycline resistance protein, class H-like [Xenia sp. Carnegie-2017]